MWFGQFFLLASGEKRDRYPIIWEIEKWVHDSVQNTCLVYLASPLLLEEVEGLLRSRLGCHMSHFVTLLVRQPIALVCEASMSPSLHIHRSLLVACISGELASALVRSIRPMIIIYR